MGLKDELVAPEEKKVFATKNRRLAEALQVKGGCDIVSIKKLDKKGFIKEYVFAEDPSLIKKILAHPDMTAYLEDQKVKEDELKAKEKVLKERINKGEEAGKANKPEKDAENTESPKAEPSESKEKGKKAKEGKK